MTEEWIIFKQIMAHNILESTQHCFSPQDVVVDVDGVEPEGRADDEGGVGGLVEPGHELKVPKDVIREEPSAKMVIARPGNADTGHSYMARPILLNKPGLNNFSDPD